MYHKYLGLEIMQNTENEANLLLPLGIQSLKVFELQGGFAPDPLTKGSAPGPRWGLCPQTPVIGSRSPRSPYICVHPHIFRAGDAPETIAGKWSFHRRTNMGAMPRINFWGSVKTTQCALLHVGTGAAAWRRTQN